MPILSVKNLNVSFDKLEVLHNISLEVERGTITAVIGPNGAGKTVFFRALLGLVSFDGSIIWEKNIKIGYVPQRLSVEKNLPLSVLEFLQFKGATDEEIYEALREVGFLKHQDRHHLEHHLLNARLSDISGGEFQRVLIAYALIGHPDILLFDEPTAGIDIGGEETIYSLLKELQQKHNLTILLITHDLNIIYRYADAVLCLNKEGVCFGSPKEALSPKVLENLYGEKIALYRHEHSH